MNREDFKALSIIRLKEAKVLFNNQCFEGAYYLAGYSVECALKACIAKNTQKYDFPIKNANTLFYTHDLSKLVYSAGLSIELDTMMNNPAFAANWAIVKDWDEESRYEKQILPNTARDLLSAIRTRGNGVLSWLKRCW